MSGRNLAIHCPDKKFPELWYLYMSIERFQLWKRGNEGWANVLERPNRAGLAGQVIACVVRVLWSSSGEKVLPCWSGHWDTCKEDWRLLLENWSHFCLVRSPRALLPHLMLRVWKWQSYKHPPSSQSLLPFRCCLPGLCKANQSRCTLHQVSLWQI